jgi:uncharacterized protein (TIGR02265 family)
MAAPATEPIVFQGAIEGLRRAFGAQLTPQISEQLRGIGINFDKLQPAYPVGAWFKAIDIAADALAKSQPLEARFRYVGRAFILGYVETPLGIAVAAACKIIGVKRTMLRMGRNFSTANNYMEVEGRDVGPKEVQLRCSVKDGAYSEALNDEKGAVALSGYRQGVLEGVLAVLKVPGKVEVMSSNAAAHDFTFRITWP